MRRKAAVFLVGALALASCKMPGEQQSFPKLAEDFVYGALALSPSAATSAGYHVHQGLRLDERLDDWSDAGIGEQRRFYHRIRERLDTLDSSRLDAEERADERIIRTALDLADLEFRSIQNFRHNPTLYVELIGNALFNPSVLEYAPKPERFRHIIQRLYRIPGFLETAQHRLADAPEVWNRVAQEENQGNIQLVDATLRAAAPHEVKADYEKAAAKALPALRRFNDFLKNELSGRTSEWRLGKEKYGKKFAANLDLGKTPEQLLAEAEAALQDARKEMARLAAPRSIEDALNTIAARHATPASYMQDARRDLEETTQFVRDKGLLTLPARANLQVIETPEFMRGAYAVGGFAPAPALEPKLGAFYWITPIPGRWPKDRIESKLREYNVYGLKLLTIHEAMPGHYVQLEYANDVQPHYRRILRNVFGNEPYVEGWAVYVTGMMLDEGYLGGDKDLRLTFLKQMLRVISNTILDIRLQTQGMTEQQALDLMIRSAFQEKEEATAKLQRAQLSSCQLPTYFAGWKGWMEVREAYRQRKGAAFSLRSFHEAALRESAVSLPILNQLLQK